MMQINHLVATCRPSEAVNARGEALAVLASLAAGLLVLGLIWLPDLPNAAGRVGADYSIWFPNLLAGVFWRLNSGDWAMPWFNPAQCGGVPLHADPQGAYLSLTQLLAFAVGPLRAIQASFFFYAAAGFLGTYRLARARLALSLPAGLLASVLFMFNGLYSARMMVGHLSFAPFMLLPAMAACAAARPGLAPRDLARRALGFGLLFAVMLQGGMAVLVLPTFLSLALVILICAVLRGCSLRVAAAVAGAGAALRLALCAGKLAAVLALMAHVPRDAYPLPGFRNAVVAAWVAFRVVFFWPTAAMSVSLRNSALSLEPHEFDYRVGPVALALMLWAAWYAWQRRNSGHVSRRRLLWDALVGLLLVPIALNTYNPPWTGLLKSLPVIRSSSMLRWFAAYMLPVALGGAASLDAVISRARGRAWLAGGGVALTLVCILATNRSWYGPDGVGIYDPSRIEAAWRDAVASGQAPPVHGITTLRDAAGHQDMSLARQNALVSGLSPLFCYDALFGYRLEAFRQGTLHDGSIFDITRSGGRTELNLKNPACTVFPGANACAPGDAFLASNRQDAAAFAGYRPFAWVKPGWAHAADWLGLASLAGVALTLAWLAATRRPGPHG